MKKTPDLANSKSKEIEIKYAQCLRIPFNNFTLFFKESMLNIEYNKMIIKDAYTIPFIICGFLYSLITFILIVKTTDREAIELISTFTFGINLLSLLLFILLRFKPNIFKCKDIKLIKLVILYEQYVIITITNCLLKQELEKNWNLKNNKYLSIGFLQSDILLKYIWLITPFNEFSFVFCCNIISVIIIISSFISGNSEVLVFIITNSILVVIHTGISYFNTKSSKSIFYLRRIASSGYNLMEVMDTGFASFSYEEKLNYSNSFFSNESFKNTFNTLDEINEDFVLKLINGDFEEKNEEVWNCINKLSEPSPSDISLNPIKRSKTQNNSGFLNNLNDISKCNYMNNNNNSNNDSRIILDYDAKNRRETNLRAIIKLSQQDRMTYSCFTYLGQKKSVNEKERKVIVLHVYFRNHYPTNSIEFIFNDESKMNYQLLFNRFVQQTSEYLHDFKNPLITLNEELKEIQETLFKYQEEEEDKYEFMFDDAFLAKIDFLISITNDCTDMIRSFGCYLKNILINTEEIELKMDTFDLNEFLQNISYWINTKINKSNKNISFKLDLQLESNFQLYSDKVKLKQVLVNILSNSFKFTTKGFILLKVVREKVKNNNKGYIKFEIEDTGRGMEDNIINTILNPFTTHNPDNLNKEGWGLGIIISKKISEKLGIALEMESFPQKGTKMWFYCEEKEIFKHQPKPKPSNSINLSNQDLSPIMNLNTSPMHQISNLLEPISLNQLKRRKSALSKLNIIKEEPSVRDNHDTICCENSLHILPTEKIQFLTSPKKRKRKFSLDLAHNAPLIFGEMNENNNIINMIIFSNLTKCYEIEFSLLSKIFQKNKTLTINRRSEGCILDKKSDMFDRRRSRTNNFDEDFSRNTKETGISRSILIVDDEESIRKYLTRQITEFSKTMAIKEENDGLDVLHMFLDRETASYEWIIIDNEMTYLNGTELVTILEFLSNNSTFQKCRFDNSILKRIVISTADEESVKYKLTGKNINITSKPMEKTFLRKLLYS